MMGAATRRRRGTTTDRALYAPLLEGTPWQAVDLKAKPATGKNKSRASAPPSNCNGTTNATPPYIKNNSNRIDFA
ncbi:hypothetical protein [Methylorubrum sp. B1-46]|jgi:hypothetical protein|uniref:hypothetical protein n=1 Tax=Methylorubrum sp. B1-46 TaxID=2897334 RepID=UPI001E3AD9CB|nr:hypothetical protein [Methylorubrum sp. B1-46]